MHYFEQQSALCQFDPKPTQSVTAVQSLNTYTTYTPTLYPNRSEANPAATYWHAPAHNALVISGSMQHGDGVSRAYQSCLRRSSPTLRIRSGKAGRGRRGPRRTRRRGTEYSRLLLPFSALLLFLLERYLPLGRERVSVGVGTGAWKSTLMDAAGSRAAGTDGWADRPGREPRGGATRCGLYIIYLPMRRHLRCAENARRLFHVQQQQQQIIL
ncbi:hypothetical protein GGR56DRAFT_189409 [Xylariaceae sp. FL0804]|nr:hypothetical protein GGR56DRAFT_189409 [Xylariaceae sp. FL0804]